VAITSLATKNHGEQQIKYFVNKPRFHKDNTKIKIASMRI
jgi:hypothetical protein